MRKVSTWLAKGKLMSADLKILSPPITEQYPDPAMFFPLPLCSPRDRFVGIAQKGW